MSGRPVPPLPPPRSRPTLLGSAIAADAKRYVGKGYVYGGPADRPGDWDCASFVSWVLGHDLKLPLPGGRWGQPGFPPHAHGPVVLDYAAWRSARDVPVPQAGDLCCWVGAGPDGHIGIAISASQMVSALNPSLGVEVTPISGTGPATAPLVYRRLSGVAPGGLSLPPVGKPPSIPRVAFLALLVAAGFAVVSVAAGLVIPTAIAVLSKATQ